MDASAEETADSHAVVVHEDQHLWLSTGQADGIEHLAVNTFTVQPGDLEGVGSSLPAAVPENNALSFCCLELCGVLDLHLATVPVSLFGLTTSISITTSFGEGDGEELPGFFHGSACLSRPTLRVACGKPNEYHACRRTPGCCGRAWRAGLATCIPSYP